jgi:hypothetical protein
MAHDTHRIRRSQARLRALRRRDVQRCKDACLVQHDGTRPRSLDAEVTEKTLESRDPEIGLSWFIEGVRHHDGKVGARREAVLCC